MKCNMPKDCGCPRGWGNTQGPPQLPQTRIPIGRPCSLAAKPGGQRTGPACPASALCFSLETQGDAKGAAFKPRLPGVRSTHPRNKWAPSRAWRHITAPRNISLSWKHAGLGENTQKTKGLEQFQGERLPAPQTKGWRQEPA